MARGKPGPLPNGMFGVSCSVAATLFAGRGTGVKKYIPVSSRSKCG